MSSIHEDLERNLRDRLARAISDYVDLCTAASIPHDEAMASLLYTLGQLHTAITAEFTSMSPTMFGELCAKWMDRVKRRAAEGKARAK